MSLLRYVIMKADESKRQWKCYGELCSLAEFAAGLDGAVVQLHHLLHVGQAESEALDVVLVAGMHAIELVEDALQVVLLYADAVVGDADAEVCLALIEGVNLDGERLVLASVLEGVVQQVEDDVCEVHLVGVDEGIVGLELHVERTTYLRHFQREGVHHVLRYLVSIEFLKLQGDVVVVEEAHLQDFLHLKTKSSGLVVNHISQTFIGSCILVDALIRQHLGSKGNGGDGGLELMRHIVNEIVLHLTDLSLSDDKVNCYQERDKQDESENHSRQHIPGHATHIFLAVRKMDINITHLTGGITTEQDNRII